MNNDSIRSSVMHYGFVIVACCCLMMGVNIGITFSCAGIFYKPVSQSLGVTVGEFGIYMSLMYIASSLLLPFAGKWIEKYSARKLLTWSSILMGLTLIGMGLCSAVWEFWIAGILLGFSVAFLLYLGFPTLVNRWFVAKVGLMMGLCSAASGIGGMIFNPIGGAVINSFGWRWAYAGFGLFILLIETPVLYLLLRDYPADKGLLPYGSTTTKKDDGVKAADVSGMEYSEAIKTPVFYAIMLFAFLMMAMSTLNLFIPGYVQSVGFTLENAAYAASAAMGGVTIGKLVLGHINDRGCLAGVMVTTIAGAAGLLSLIVGGHSLLLLLLGAFMFGWAYAGVTVQTAMLTRTVFGNRAYARINAIVSIALAAGGAIASGGWGFIVDRTSFHTIFYIGVAMLAVCLAIGFVALKRKS